MTVHRAAVRERARAKGVQLSAEAVRELEEHVAEVVDRAAEIAVKIGGRRVSAAILRRAMENAK